MKILVVHNRYRATAPSGENAVVDQESSALSSRGHDVVLFQRHSDDIASWSPLRRATLPARVLWSENSQREISAAITRVHTRRRARSQHLPLGHAVGPLRMPRRLGPRRRHAAQLQAGLCERGFFARRAGLPRLPGRFLPACSGPRLLPRLAVIDSPSRSRVAAREAWRTMVTAYIFISSAQRDLLEPVGLPADRSFVKHNFVPPPPHRAEVATEHLVAFVGRLDAVKGVPFLMRAWDAFRACRPGSPLRLVVAGGGVLSTAVARGRRDAPL